MATFVSFFVLSTLLLVVQVQGVLNPCGKAYYDPTKVRSYDVFQEIPRFILNCSILVHVLRWELLVPHPKW